MFVYTTMIAPGAVCHTASYHPDVLPLSTLPVRRQLRQEHACKHALQALAYRVTLSGVPRIVTGRHAVCSFTPSMYSIDEWGMSLVMSAPFLPYTGRIHICRVQQQQQLQGVLLKGYNSSTSCKVSACQADMTCVT